MATRSLYLPRGNGSATARSLPSKSISMGFGGLSWIFVILAILASRYHPYFLFFLFSLLFLYPLLLYVFCLRCRRLFFLLFASSFISSSRICIAEGKGFSVGPASTGRISFKCGSRRFYVNVNSNTFEMRETHAL